MPSLLFPQSAIEPSKLRQFNITINFDEYTVKTQMLSQSKSISVNNDRIYMWYGAQKIIETKGGYDGKLIHGTYRAFYLNNQLKEQGQINYGLRHKKWKYWYPDGNLKEVISWKNGVKNGTYFLYNDYGQMMAKGRFRKDKLHGKFYTYDPSGKITDKKKYRKGNEVIPKVHAKKTRKKINLFKKKKKTEEEEEKAVKTKQPFFKRLFVTPKKEKKEKRVKTKKTISPETKKKTVTT